MSAPVRIHSSLWDVESTLSTAFGLLEDADGEHDPSAEAMVIQALDVAETKRDQVAEFIGTMDAWEHHLDNEITRLQAKRDRAKRVRKRVEAYVMQVMLANGVRELAGATHKLKIVKNPPSVQLDENLVLPEELIRVVVRREPDKVAIKKQIEAGNTIPGARIVQNERLAVR